MELLYIWIEDFGIVKDQEFHFSKTYDIEFERDRRRLIISKPPIAPLKLFNEAFLNITAIIGKNGSGKSTMFSFIKTFFSNNSYYGNYQCILLIKISDEEFLLIDNYSRKQYELSIVNRVEGLEVKISKKQPSREITELTNSTCLITLSNAFSIYEREQLGERYLDISFNRTLDLRSIKSNKMLIERYENILKEYEIKEKDQEYESHKNVLTNFTLPRYLLYHYDLQAKVNFISKYKNENWYFIPKIIEISFNQLFYFNNKNSFIKLGLGDSLNKIEEILFMKQIITFERNEQIELFKDRIVLSLFLFYSLHDRYYYPRNESLKTRIEVIASLENSDQIIKAIKTFFAETSPVNSIDPLNKIKYFYSILENQFDSFKYIEQHDNTYRTYFSDEVFISLDAIFEIWLDNDFIFAFSWHDLSAGESALLSLFSRIHSIAKAPVEDTIWLLIDEGDLYLHPEWQRTFFSDLHTYLPKFFKGKMIQLFLTSHSPFIVSDLPKDNIMLLKREDETGLCKVVPLENLGETFGANIHELLANAFFMEHGTIGEFAKGKIDSLFHYLNSKEIEDEYWNFETALKLIEIVGDNIIKQYLIELYNKKIKQIVKDKNDIGYINDLMNFLKQEGRKMRGGEE